MDMYFKSLSPLNSKARELLPILHDVVRAVERDNADTSAKNKDSLEAMNKVKELHRAIEAIREDINAMPGIERSKSDQLKQLQALRLVEEECLNDDCNVHKPHELCSTLPHAISSKE